MSVLKPKRGHPTLATPVTLAKIIVRVRGGLRLSSSAQAEGIHSDTLSKWRGFASLGKEPWAEFFQDVSRAESEFEAECLESIVAASKPSETGDGDYKASTWILERTRPEAYAAHMVLLTRAEDNVMEALIDKLKPALSESAWAEVVAALDIGTGDDEPESE